MKWTVKVNNDEREKIDIVYHPLNDMLVFSGKYYVRNFGWFEFCTEEMKVESNDIDLLEIQAKLASIHNKLKSRSEIHANLSEGLIAMKKVEITEISNE